MSEDPGRICILGAGPTGLGAAYRLQELGFHDFQVLEAGSEPGGLAASVTDEKGFTWDLGGHVQFSHYGYYDDVLDRALADQWLYHQRQSWVRIKDRFVPYPLQHNVHRLEAADRERVLAGLECAGQRQGAGRPASFAEWITHTFGEALSELFLRPYNAKVWAYPLEAMSWDWIGERVALPDLERIRQSIALSRDEVAWGPNTRFRFPRRGGTGAIWRAVARMIAPARVSFSHPVAGVDLQERRVVLEDGRRVRYDTLLSTLPLDQLCRMAHPLSPEVRHAAARLRHNSVHVLGVGLRGPKPPSVAQKSWMYFPSDRSPYYRVTVFSNYSPHNVPEGGDYWSLMAEVSESPHRSVRGPDLVGEALEAMIGEGLVEAGTEVVSRWQRRLEYGYPIPTLERDECLGTILPALARDRIHARGRFGAWRYEVSNQDHSFMQGVELMSFLLTGEPERTVRGAL